MNCLDSEADGDHGLDYCPVLLQAEQLSCSSLPNWNCLSGFLCQGGRMNHSQHAASHRGHVDQADPLAAADSAQPS